MRRLIFMLVFSLFWVSNSFSQEEEKKEEDQELQILRKMARRLNLLHHNDLLPKNHSEALMEKDENQFYRILN